VVQLGQSSKYSNSMRIGGSVGVAWRVRTGTVRLPVNWKVKRWTS
jgi:hypothetical protein